MKRIVIAAALAALAGPALAQDARSISSATSEILSRFEPSGETVDCIIVRRIASIRPVSETTLLVKTGVNEYYVNETSGRCARATGMNTRIEYSMPQTTLCRLQIINIVDNTSGMLLGTCSLGSFEKLKEKAPAEEEPA